MVPIRMGLKGPVEWEECSVCGGRGEVFPVYYEPYLPAWDTRPRSEAETEALARWVAVYREARKDGLPPDWAATLADERVRGPLPF